MDAESSSATASLEDDPAGAADIASKASAVKKEEILPPKDLKQKKKMRQKTNLYVLLFGGVGILVILAIVLGLVFGLEQEDEIVYLRSTATSVPTTSREFAIRTELAQVVPQAAQQDELDSPEEKAIRWLLFEDPLQLDELSDHLVQRLVLALFYFKTSEVRGEWLSCNPSTSNDTSCMYYDNVRGSDLSFGASRATRWLSGVHECQWAQVACYEGNEGPVVGIEIEGQNLTGTMPAELIHLDQLEWLSLGFNHFTGTIPEAYGAFQHLTRFEALENHLVGQIPKGVFQLPSLQTLNICGNRITGTLPSEIGNAKALSSVFLHDTDISGIIPTEIGLLENLHTFCITDTFLSGPIPSEVGRLSLLRMLLLSNNKLSGPLPSELGLLPNLEELQLSKNQMEGASIPEELWNITSLTAIDLDGAGLEGTISTNIGKLANLMGLKASRNNFEGTVPTEIGQLSDLLLLWLHVNENLIGEVPAEVCAKMSPYSF